MIKLVKGKKC